MVSLNQATITCNDKYFVLEYMQEMPSGEHAESRIIIFFAHLISIEFAFDFDFIRDNIALLVFDCVGGDYTIKIKSDSLENLRAICKAIEMLLLERELTCDISEFTFNIEPVGV